MSEEKRIEELEYRLSLLESHFKMLEETFFEAHPDYVQMHVKKLRDAAADEQKHADEFRRFKGPRGS